MSSNTITSRPTFDLLEALAIDPVEDDTTATQSVRNVQNSDAEGCSDNDEQLIRETDEAFQAVGTALAGAKAATQGWYDETSSNPSPNIPTPRGILKRSPRSVSPFRASLSRPLSVSKGKRKKPSKKKTNLLGRARRTVPPSPANTPSRWTLTEMTTNVAVMADVFTGKMFRTEADEKLILGKTQHKRNISIESVGQASIYSGRSIDTSGSTPTEPFHLESLSSRISAAQLNPPLCPSLELPRPATPQLRRRFDGNKPAPRKVKLADSSAASAADTGMVFKDLNFPSPPRTPISRQQADSRSAPSLPTIPEISPLSLQFPDSVKRTCKGSSSTSNVITLCSTAYTLTSPLFRHGPIRVERLPKNDKSSSPEGEALDWTAFQMAISGTMDDEGGGDGDRRDDWEWETDEVEMDEIVDWCASLRLDVGRLERESKSPMEAKKEVKKPPRNMQARVDDKEVVFQEINWQGHVSGEKIRRINDFGSRRWNGSTLSQIAPEDRGSRIPFANTAVKRKPSAPESLPPSPMLDIALPNIPNRAGGEVIPMGFNLGHDLGDFLNWEAHNVQTLFDDNDDS